MVYYLSNDFNLYWTSYEGDLGPDKANINNLKTKYAAFIIFGSEKVRILSEKYPSS